MNLQGVTSPERNHSSPQAAGKAVHETPRLSFLRPPQPSVALIGRASAVFTRSVSELRPKLAGPEECEKIKKKKKIVADIGDDEQLAPRQE